MARRHRIVNTYVLTEILGPAALGLLIFTFLLLIDVVFDLVALVIQRNVPALLVGRLLLLNLPHILVITIPMALLFGILIAIGRLAADSELVALRASGVSLFALYWPVFGLSSVLAVVTAIGAIYAQPWGNQALVDMKTVILNRGLSKEVQPGVFYEQINDRILLVDGENPSGNGWQGVFFTDSLPLGNFVVTVAEAGSVDVDAEGGSAVLELTNSLDYTVKLDEPEQSDLVRHGQVEYVLEDLLSGREERQNKRGVRELGLQELSSLMRDTSRSDRERRAAKVEWNKKIAIPATCLVFGLFGLPLGFNNRRGGRSSGFTLSLVVILAYYILLNNGERMAIQGSLSPVVAMWLPNLVFLSLGLYLLGRRNSDKSLLVGRIDRWLRLNLWPRFYVRRRLRQQRKFRRKRLRIEEHQVRESRSRDRPSPSADVVLRLEHPRFRFPNTFDRYLLLIFGRVFLLVLASSLSIYIIANFATLLEDILQHDIAGGVILEYYGYLSFQIFHRLAPLVVLLSTLISFGILARNNEITAVKALGTSLYRLTVPVLAAASVIALISAFVGSAILPSANARATELRDQINGNQRVRTYKRADQQWVFNRDAGGNGYIFHYQYYDAERQALQRLHVFRLSPGDRHLTGHLYATEAAYAGDGWRVSGAWAKSIDETRAVYHAIANGQRIDLHQTPDLFNTEIRYPDQMSYAELQDYIAQLQSGGQDVPKLEVQLYNKLAQPAVCLVMALVAFPFAFQLGQRGALYGVGIALALGMAFYALIALFTTLGQTGTLPALVAVWSPNLLFAVVSLYLFLGIRT